MTPTDPGWNPVHPDLWLRVQTFLLLGETGRVTLHVEHGIVRMVETTAFVRQKRENPVDKKLTDRVESP